MKILFIFHNTGLGGGANLSGLTLIRGLKECGHDVRAVCNAEGEMAEILRNEGFNPIIAGYHVAWPSAPHTLREWIMYIPKAIRNRIHNRRAAGYISTKADRFRPDVIHSNSSVIDVGSMISRRLHIPHVTHFREYGLRDTNCVMWHLKRMLRHPLNHNIAIARDIALFHKLNLDSDSRIIYNGIIKQEECRINAQPGEYLLYVGQLNKAKGIEDLLKGYATLSDDIRSRFPLLIAGNPSRKDYIDVITEMSESLGISGNIKLLGHRNDVADLMYNALALVVPSHNEAFGRIIPEAMANGCLVIGRDTAGIKEQFDNGLYVTGHEIALRFTDITSLTLALKELCANPLNPQYAGMKEFAMTTVKELYTRQSYIKAVESFYQSIVK